MIRSAPGWHKVPPYQPYWHQVPPCQPVGASGAHVSATGTSWGAQRGTTPRAAASHRREGGELP
jgi:hypothetical protein